MRLPTFYEQNLIPNWGNKTEVASLLSYNDSEGNAPADSSYQDSIFKDQTLQEVKAVARKPGTVT